MSRPKRTVRARSAAIEAAEDEAPIVSESPPKRSVPTGMPSFIAEAVRTPAPTPRTVVPFAQRVPIPKSLLGYEWEKSGRPDSDRWFSMRGVTPDIEHKSAEVSGSSGSVIPMIQHQILLCICKIGDELTHQNHAMITAWLHDIGAKGRGCVMRLFNKMNSAEEDEFETFLDSVEPDFDF